MTLETAKCSSAVMAEKEGFIACLDSARETFSNESPLETVTTDGNLSIRSYMKEHGERLGVIHALDLWHLNKNLAKNLTKKCTNKVFTGLAGAIKYYIGINLVVLCFKYRTSVVDSFCIS